MNKPEDRSDANVTQQLSEDHEKGREEEMSGFGSGIGDFGGNVQRVDSTSDARNVMRHEYKVLSDEEKVQMKKIKDMGLEFFSYLDSIGRSREISLAKTKVEEAVMWAVKHVTS